MPDLRYTVSLVDNDASYNAMSHHSSSTMPGLSPNFPALAIFSKTDMKVLLLAIFSGYKALNRFHSLLSRWLTVT
jgi:hypothetical protein